MPVFLSLVIVHHDQIDPRHLDFMIDALNRQTHSGFNTFWINQVQDPGPLQAALGAAARFPWVLVQTGHPVVAGLVCWELVGVFARLMEHPAMGRWFVYLHLECLPAPELAGILLALLPEIEAHYGPRTICMLQQLWTEFSVGELDPVRYPEQLRLSDGLVWYRRSPYAAYRRSLGLSYFECGWEEDAFAMPSALARELMLFSAVRPPLWFQDVFDIFAWLGSRPYGADLRWVRLLDAVIWHLYHPRTFLEYRRPFLDAVREHPELFGHLALYELAQSEAAYHEPEELRRINWTSDALTAFYRILRQSPRGSLGWWQYELDRAHGLEGRDEGGFQAMGR